MSGSLGPVARAFFEDLAFAPDRFQVEAVEVLERGESVVVTAPTGAGKTLVAEAAVRIAFEEGTRAFYTTPIKALSNQKFADFSRVYGADKVGLLTGDNVINGEAPIVVMTTEVLRNMIYADSAALDSLSVVILDEVHYLQDRYRGSVWEEVIIHLPLRIKLVSLSATIANATEFTEWVAARRGPTSLVVEDHRPVPLESLYMVKDRHREGGIELLPVFAKGGKANPAVDRLLKKGRGRFSRFATPRRLEVTEELARSGLLPAIYFVFSRAGCEQAAQQVAGAGLGLAVPDDVARIRAVAEERTQHLADQDLTVLGYGPWLGLLEQGVAAHHAGMVPAFKETVEELFTAGLIKIVFATETLALGINMPARTVVLERLSKFTGEDHELLQAGDYTQLTGRAGRRGIDTEGTAVVLHSPHIPFAKVAAIAGAGSHPLLSSFQPTYNMAVNLVANYPQARAEELLNASFAQFRAEKIRSQIEGSIAAKRHEVEEFRAAAECDRGDIWAYLEAGEEIVGHRDVMQAFVQRTHPGDVFALGSTGGRWILLARGYGANPRMLLLSEQAEVRRLSPEQLPAGTVRLGSVDLPQPFRPRDTAYQRGVARRLRSWEPPIEPDHLPAPDSGSEGPVDPVAACPDLSDHRKWARRSMRAQRELDRMQRQAATSTEGLVGVFRAILRLLEEWRYVSGWHLTARGERLRFVYNELDLVLTEAVHRNAFDGLTAAEFTALCSMFTYEARMRDPVGDWPNRTVAGRGEQVEVIHRSLADEERERRLPETRAPDGGFAEVAYYWASGADLEDLFENDELAAGDFVRNCRQLLDLMRQLRDAFPDLRETASTAIRAVDRGVVAAGGRL